MSGELVPFPTLHGLSQPEAAAAAQDFLAAANEDRLKRIDQFKLGEPETLLALCQLLDEKEESGPAIVLEAGITAYRHVESLPEQATRFLFDEREYYLGELARIIGCCLRLLSRRDECREWLDRAESQFLLTANSSADVARVAYQRLALYIEERRLSLVLELSKPLSDTFLRFGAKESALKCRYVGALTLREMGRLHEALDEFQQICVLAREIASNKILGPVLVTLVQIHSDLGQVDAAVRQLAEAEPFLRAQQNRVGLGKLYWGLGLVLRQQGKIPDAIAALRTAQQELLSIEMKADVAALHLVIADLLLDTGQERQAEWEIRAALPVIDELKMVPEGFAAMSLLRESLRRRSIDRQALRKLHGYFEEAGS